MFLTMFENMSPPNIVRASYMMTDFDHVLGLLQCALYCPLFTLFIDG